MIIEKDFTFPSEDKENTISAKWWVKEGEKPKAILQIIHGMTEHKGRYEAFGRYMAEQGYMVCIHDHLGHGESVKSLSDLGYINVKGSSDYMIADIHKLREIAQKAFPETKHIMLGHSMGSYMLRKYLTYRGEGLVGAIIMGTGYQPSFMANFGLFLCNMLAKFKGWGYRSKAIRQITYSKPYRGYDMTGTDTSNSWLTRDEEIVEIYYADPKCSYLFTLAGYKALFEAVSFSCNRKNADKIRKDLPMLLISGAEDPVGARGKGVKRVHDLYKSVGIKNITMKLYPDARHEVLNEINKEEVFRDISEWMDKVLVQRSRWRKWISRPDIEGEFVDDEQE